MDDTARQHRLKEIHARLEAWDERHAGHREAGTPCGCDVYNDVIYGLFEYDPMDAPNRGLVAVRMFVLLDGTVIDGTERRGDRTDWKITGPGELLRRPQLPQPLCG